MRANERVKELESTTASQIWLRDLDEFMSCWTSMKEERIRLLSGDGVKQKGKKVVKR
jgi:hypothetical protein